MSASSPSNSALSELEIGTLMALPAGMDDRSAPTAYDGRQPVVIAHSSATQVEAAVLLEALALQLLRLHTQGGAGAKVALFESVPSPRFAHLKRLLARTGKRYGQHLLGEDDYRQHLQTLCNLAHQRFVLLANLELTHWAQCLHHPKIRKAEPWHFVLVSEVLAHAGREENLAALQTLCQQGPQVGIVPLLLRSPAEQSELEREYGRRPLHAFWADVAPAAWGFDWRSSPPQPVNQLDIYWRSLRRFDVQVGVPPEHMQAWVAELVQSQTQQLQAAEFPDFLQVPIGHEGSEEVCFPMGAASRIFNAMLGGSVGSGKTTIVHNVLLGACEVLTPAQLELWVLDPSGLEFKSYAQLPHTRFLHCALKFDDRLYAALVTYETQWAERAQKLGQADVSSIDEYNAQQAHNGQCMARSLLVIDEAHHALNDRKVQALVGRIAREGRKYGLHMVLLTQSFQALPFDNATKDQIRLRIGCQMGASASRNLFEHDNEAAAQLVNAEGVRLAIVNTEGGHPSANRTVHLLPLVKGERNRRMAALAQRYPGWPRLLEPLASKVVPNNSGSAGEDVHSGDFDPGQLT